MSTKTFLPSKLIPMELEKLASSPSSRGGGVINRKFFPKCLCAVGLVTFVTILTMLGFSISVVKDNEIGFYTYGPFEGYYGPGTYIESPWSKNGFRTASVTNRTLTIWHRKGSVFNSSDYKYSIESVLINYEISDPAKYVIRMRRSESEVIFEKDLTNEISFELDEILTKASHTDLQSNSIDFETMSVGSSFGIEIVRVTCSRPKLTQHASDITIRVANDSDYVNNSDIISNNNNTTGIRKRVKRF